MKGCCRKQEKLQKLFEEYNRGTFTQQYFDNLLIDDHFIILNCQHIIYIALSLYQFDTQLPNNQYPLLMSKEYITSSAYLDELQSWEQSLKLLIKQITLLQKSSDISKSFQNDIQILITEMQSQLLKYRREKTRVMSATQNISQFSNIIGHFENCNEKFNELIERGNSVIEELGQASKSENRGYEVPQMKMTDRTKSKFHSIKKTSREKGNKNLVADLEVKRGHAKSFQQTRVKNKNSKLVSMFDSSDSELKLEFVNIKNSIKQLHKLLDTHQHPIVEQQINKLKLSNTKILMDIKMLKEEHAYMQNQIFEMKKQINQEKKNQIKMERKYKGMQEKVDSRAVGNVPEWVRMRVNNRT